MALEEGHVYGIFDMHRCLRTCPRIIGTGFSGEDTSRTIRTGFTDRFVVSHGTQEIMEICIMLSFFSNRVNISVKCHQIKGQR